MNGEIFRENLLKTIADLFEDFDSISNDKYKFLIIPVYEEGKTYNSKDDYMRLWVLSEKNLKNRYFDLEGVVKLFSGLAPLFPLWINISVKEIQMDGVVFEIKTSLRFRKPSLLKNQDTTHPPFKAINKTT
jgi:hypothetical protein